MTSKYMRTHDWRGVDANVSLPAVDIDSMLGSSRMHFQAAMSLDEGVCAFGISSDFSISKTRFLTFLSNATSPGSCDDNVVPLEFISARTADVERDGRRTCLDDDHCLQV